MRRLSVASALDLGDGAVDGRGVVAHRPLADHPELGVDLGHGAEQLGHFG